MKSFIIPPLAFLLLSALLSCQAQRPSAYVQSLPGLVSFWDFQPQAGKDALQAAGTEPAQLLTGDQRATLRQTEGGVFGPNVLHVEEGGWLYVPREKLGQLNIFGAKASVTVVAWVKRESEKHWQAIAGVWDESRSKRQYFLFMNARARSLYPELVRAECQNRVHGHISALGGKTPGREAWVSYASGRTEIPNSEWRMIAMSYDGQHIRVFVDGALDALEQSNPFPYTEGIFDGGPDGAPFTIGCNSVRNTMTNAFAGQIAGVAVFNQALPETQIRQIYEATMTPKN